jgi:alanyl-tRNA synthetase
LLEKRQHIEDVFAAEEEKFARALRKGMRALEDIDQLSGEVAFDLYQTYGFPFELTQEIAQERGEEISRESFDEAKEAHAKASRQASAGKFKGGLADQSEQTTQYHTATHLLHAALQKVLGDHAIQAGSNITAQRLRFDFEHDAALTDEEIEQVEQQVNDWIEADLPVSKQTMPFAEAVETGAIHLFNENYPDSVSVYTIGDEPGGEKGIGWVSKELCGGPHVERTGEIDELELYKEKSAGAGVRRVYMRVDE